MDFPRLHTLDSFLSIPIVIFGLLKVVSCIYANRLGLRYNIYIIASIVFLSAAVAVLVLSVHGLEWTSTASPIPAFYFPLGLCYSRCPQLPPSLSPYISIHAVEP